jgi:hypothetical protein
MFLNVLSFPMAKFCDKNAKTAVVAVLLVGSVPNVSHHPRKASQVKPMSLFLAFYNLFVANFVNVNK